MRALLFGLSLAFFALPAWAQTKSDLEAQCLARDPDVQVSGCTALIQSAVVSGNDLAITYFNRGNAYTRKGLYDQAIADYSQAISLGPNNADFYNNRGIAYEREGRREQAIGDYSTALRFNPPFALAMQNLQRLSVATAKTTSDRIEASYYVAFCRPPQPAELQFWSGDPRSARLDTLIAAHRFWLKTTPVSRQEMLTLSYQMEFQRDPHDDEMAYWDGQVAEKGHTCAEVLALHESWKKANMPGASQ